MSSGSEKRYSVEELTELNRAAEPTEQARAERLALQGQTNRLLTRLAERLEDYPPPPSLSPVVERLEAIEQELTAIRQLMERPKPAGRRSGRRISWPRSPLPRLRLPRPSWGWLFLPAALVALWAIWRAWSVLWTTLTTWLA